MFCDHKGSLKYDSLVEAYEECTRDKKCSGIFESNCGFAGKIVLCFDEIRNMNGGGLEKDANICVHKKQGSYGKDF